MEEISHLACIDTQFLIAFAIINTIGSLLYWTIHSLEKRQTVIEDKLLAKMIARKLYQSLQQEKTV